MKTKTWIIGLAILALGAAAYSASAWGPGPAWSEGEPGWQGFGPGQGACREAYLGLPEETRKQLDELDRIFFEETRDLRNQHWTKRGELKNLMASDSLDPEAAKKLQAEISQLMGQMQQKRLEYRLEAEKIAPELKEFRRYGGSGMGKGMRKGMGGGPGFCWGY